MRDAHLEWLSDLYLDGYEKSLFCWKIREEKGNIKLNIGAASCEQAVRTSVISLSSDARAIRHTRLPARLSNIS